MKIGLEIHVQLRTRTKLFCGCENKGVTDVQGASSELRPNTLTCEYCIGLPGSKPRVNKAAMDFAILIGSALNCKINSPTFFSRKAYFYPDMGKNFQITQYELPVAHTGHVKLGVKNIHITRIQVEEDPARLVHMDKYCLVDYNRSGVPLCEIVTDPDFESPREAREFLQKLSSILEYLGVYDPSIEGSMRVDANVSVESQRVEIKNISGFKEVEKALNYEIIRQKNLLRRKQTILRETRGWDADAGVTRSQRTKEEEADYGYIFEGDLPKFTFSKDYINELRKGIPELPDEKIKRYAADGIPKELAVSIVSEPDLAEAFEHVSHYVDKNIAAKWFAGEIKKTLNYNNLRLKDSKLHNFGIIKLLELVNKKSLTEHSAEMLLREMVVKHIDPEKIGGNERITDERSLEDVIREVLDTNTKAIMDYKSGKNEAFNFLVGKAVQKTKGRGDPASIRRIMKRMI